MLSTSADDAITLHYQPLAECGGKVVGFEALMRWHHRQRGNISPEAFIPIFESSGLIVPLSRWALHQACLDAASWKRALRVAVNLSAMQFHDDDLPQLARDILVETALAPERLELEITEAALLAEPSRTLAMLTELRAEGVQIALDAFGTGRLDAAVLGEYPLSKIKIDRGIVANIETSESARSIIHMAVELGHALGLAVAAAGVETDSQLSYLREQGCDVIQGFLIGRPAPIEAFAALTGGRSQSYMHPAHHDAGDVAPLRRSALR